MEIFLDLDGLLADIHSVMLHQLHIFKYRNNWPKGMYFIRAALSIERGREVTEEEVWKELDVFNLYEMCPAMHDARMIVSYVSEYDPNFKICTALHCPSEYYADLARGKIKWCQKFFGNDFVNIRLTDVKSEIANPNRLLVDDLETNVKSFKRAGGQAILYPRPWNLGDEENVLENFRISLEQICRERIVA